MSRKLSRAPVYFTIVQVRFNPIMALDSYAAAIQESFRKRGYPDAERGVLTTFSFNPNVSGDASPQVPVVQAARYTFQNMRKTAGFILEQGALSFQTTEYDVFETFSAEFLDGLKIINDAVGLSYSERVGFRYLDAVFPRSGEQISDYLKQWMLGLYGRIEGQVAHAFSETMVNTQNARVLARSIIQDGVTGFPPDLQPMTLTLAERFQVLRGIHAILDVDGSYEMREAFDTDNVQSRLSAIHDEIGKAFLEIVTDHAMKVWA